MPARPTISRFLAGPEEWNRRRLQLLLGVAVVLVAAVVAGLGWSTVALLHVGSATSPDNHAGATTEPGSGAMLDDDTLSEAQPGPLSTGSVGRIRVPQPALIGPAQVGTGLPHSPAGALAQLVAIDQRAIGSASVVTAQDVIGSWAAPGGPTSASWSGVKAVETLVESAGLPANGSADLTIRLDPAMGLIRDETADAVTVCVDFIVAATVDNGLPTQIAAADCQHMTWRDQRWVIAAGPEPTPIGSLWPGTQASYDAGYEWLEIRP